jgi:hypothetical protein
MATPDRLDAYEAWYAAKRALDDAMPWTPDWLRLRMIEQELRTAYERVADEQETPGTTGNHVRERTVAKGD